MNISIICQISHMSISYNIIVYSKSKQKKWFHPIIKCSKHKSILHWILQLRYQISYSYVFKISTILHKCVIVKNIIF